MIQKQRGVYALILLVVAFQSIAQPTSRLEIVRAGAVDLTTKATEKARSALERAKKFTKNAAQEIAKRPIPAGIAASGILMTAGLYTVMKRKRAFAEAMLLRKLENWQIDNQRRGEARYGNGNTRLTEYIRNSDLAGATYEIDKEDNTTDSRIAIINSVVRGKTALDIVRELKWRHWFSSDLSAKLKKIEKALIDRQALTAQEVLQAALKMQQDKAALNH